MEEAVAELAAAAGLLAGGREPSGHGAAADAEEPRLGQVRHFQGAALARLGGGAEDGPRAAEAESWLREAVRLGPANAGGRPAMPP